MDPAVLARHRQEDIEYLRNIEKEIASIPKDMAEEYRSTQSAKLQQELINILRDKVGTDDRDKARVFVNKLSLLANNNNLKIDEITQTKLYQLFAERKQITDEEVFQGQIDAEIMAD